MRQIYCDNGSTSFPKAPGLGEQWESILTITDITSAEADTGTLIVWKEKSLKPEKRYAGCFIVKVPKILFLYQEPPQV